MLNRLFAIALALMFTLPMASPVNAGEVVINYEFSDEPHIFGNKGKLGSAGGWYWNRVGSSFFTTPQEFGAERDEFGNLIPPGDPFAFPPTQQVPTLRTRIFQQAAVVSSPLVTQGPGIGSLVFEGQNIVEIINTFPGSRYDVVVYYRPVISSPTGSIKLSDVGGYPIADPSFVESSFGGYSAAVFTDVRPIEMHIGPAGYFPFGFGVGYYTGGSFDQSLVEISGIQIRGVIPEPSAFALAGLSIIAFAAIRRRK